MNEHYLLASVTSIEPTTGYGVRVIFDDGFLGEVDLSPLLECGPIFAPLRDPAYFRAVTLSPYGVPTWSDTLDLSPGSLRAWCEAGKYLDDRETDDWIARRIGDTQKVA